MSIDRRSLRRILGSIPLEANRWVVAGSAPMQMAGLIDSISDVDIVADQVAWRHAVSLADQRPKVGEFGDRMVALDVVGFRVEVFDSWLGTHADEMIAEAIELEGFRFSPLSRVLESKRQLARNKDLVHIELLEALPTEGPTADGG